jgi:hypothetical protein
MGVPWERIGTRSTSPGATDVIGQPAQVADDVQPRRLDRAPWGEPRVALLSVTITTHEWPREWWRPEREAVPPVEAADADPAVPALADAVVGQPAPQAPAPRDGAVGPTPSPAAARPRPGARRVPGRILLVAALALLALVLAVRARSRSRPPRR